MGFLMGMMGGGNDGYTPAPAPAAPAPTTAAAAVQPEQTIQPVADTTKNSGKKKAVLGLSQSTLGSTSSSAQTIGKTSLLGG